MKFKRSIGTFPLLLTAIGGIIGSGWLFGPLYAAQIAGPAAIISWIIGGILMMIIAFTFAELGSSFPVAGSMVRFAEYSHGPLFSFTIGWMIWLSSVIVAPVETMAIVQYMGIYIPQLVSKINGTHVMSSWGIAAAAVIMLIMCILNWHGAKFFSRTSTFIVLLKLLVPILVVIILFSIGFNGHNFHAVGGFAANGWQSIFAALPLGGVIYSFIGYSPVLQLAEEAKNPQRAIPFAIIGALIFCIILYTLLQITFIGILPASDLAHGWRYLSFTGDSGPFAGILISFGIVWAVILIYADAIVSPFGTGFIYTTSTARVSYSLSQIGFFPALFRKLTKNGVPMRAIVINYVLGLFMFLPFPGWQSMVSFIISCFVISYIIGPIALIALRKADPDRPRPFRLPFPYLFTLLAFYICNLLVYWTGWNTVSRLLIALAIGLTFFIIHSIKRKDKLWVKQWRTSWWLIPYLICLGVISYLGSFGNGMKVIPFGADFVIIAALTVVTFILAITSANKKDIQAWESLPEEVNQL